VIETASKRDTPEPDADSDEIGELGAAFIELLSVMRPEERAAPF
jgi:hypothetical protein